MDYTQRRDGGGRFTDEFVPDAELAAKVAEDNRRANLAAEVMDRIGLPHGFDGICRNATGEHSWLGVTSTAALRGAMYGLLFGLNNSAEDAARMLADTLDALGMMAALRKLLDERRSA